MLFGTIISLLFEDSSGGLFVVEGVGQKNNFVGSFANGIQSMNYFAFSGVAIKVGKFWFL